MFWSAMIRWRLAKILKALASQQEESHSRSLLRALRSPVDSSTSNQCVLVLTPDSHPADGVSAQQIDGTDDGDGSSLAPSVKLVTV